MVNQIKFNNKYSFDDFGLLMVESPTISNSYENVESINVPGRSGSLIKRLGTFNNRIINIKFKLIDMDQSMFDESLINIINWLNNIKDNKLIINDSMYSYKVKYVEIGDIQRQLNWYGDFEVTFICEPFKYGLDKSVTITTATSISYLGTVKTQPTITVTCVGDITLIVGDKSILLKNIVDNITIDSKMMMCYKNVDGIYTNLNQNMSGEYPELKPGTTEISWIGNVTNIKIDYETKYL